MGLRLAETGPSGHNYIFMTAIQEEALYDFLDNATRPFELDEAVSYIKKTGPVKTSRLTAEVDAFIKTRNLAFPSGERRWVSRRTCFEPLTFVISPTRLELVNGILIPGHRCVPFVNAGLLPQEYNFFWQGRPVPDTTTEGPPEEFYRFYSIFGEEYAPQYVARDNDENEEAFNSDPYDDPPEVSIRTLDMRNIYREVSFVPGDRFTVRTIDWKEGSFALEKVSREEWAEEDLAEWLRAAEEGFAKSFANPGPAFCTEEQIAFAYWHGGTRMREVPAYSLEEFLYEKTDRVETTAYGIETRFWHAGREIPDLKNLDSGGARPDRTPVEEILHKLKIPVSEYVIQSYGLDSLFRENGDADMVVTRLVPPSVDLAPRDRKLLAEYVEGVLAEFRLFYNPFTDKKVGSIRQRAGELHTAVIDLASRLGRGDIDQSWLPRHTFIVLSQIQSHTAAVMEDLDSDESPPEDEYDAVDNSLDSMIETYEDIKAMIDEALDSFRRNKLSVIRAGSSAETVTERLLQVSIGGIDVWRRLIVPESCPLAELHRIIQTVFGWRDSQDHRFSAEKEETLDGETLISDLEDRSVIELLYEYGQKWTVRIMILSRYETPGSRPVRCVAGAGAAPPEFIGGPLKFRKALFALESGNDMDRLGARQELGTEFTPDDFDINVCNRLLNTVFSKKGQDR